MTTVEHLIECETQLVMLGHACRGVLVTTVVSPGDPADYTRTVLEPMPREYGLKISLCRRCTVRLAVLMLEQEVG